ncbi:ShlB/FhaC/HecB family hemolysin secretion/activation protein [Salinicola endophyticus]|uniref:ShlB/FhaC/HecB family hemolysin secretion/activation protein n=1 Tax=Salinicola endophyticus TaxID=1949083 RepID=UPI001FDAC0B0|nr:ShlB/FhaC/HecB family hemolysin secretion/activation protein [Salinicola endophyticus]
MLLTILWIPQPSMWAMESGARVSESGNFELDEPQRRLEQQRQRLEALERLPAAEETPSALPLTKKAGRCLPIRALDLEGVTLLNTRLRQSLSDDIVGHCATAEDLNELLKAITQTYLDRGYVTSRAYLPQQDLSTGTLRVIVVEGRIEAFASQNDAISDRELNMASPVSAGARLNIRDLEQLIDQLNRLPSHRAKLALQPGEEVGGSIVGVEDTPSRPVRFSLGRNNSGSQGTGEQQWQAGMSWDNPFGLADQLTLQWGRAVTRRHDADSGSRYFQYEVPYGYWTFDYTYSRSQYRTQAEGNGFIFALDGTSEKHAIGLERVLLRDRTSKTGVSVGLSKLSTRNNIDGTRIEVSSQRLSELSLGVNHGRRLGSALINADIGWQHGLTRFGAQQDHGAVDGQPTAQYQKNTLTLSYWQPFSLLGQTLSFESFAHGQWSHDVLYSPQRLTIGGESTVRGFKEQSLSGDSGGYWRNEVTWRHPFDIARPLFDTWNLSLAYDVGVIRHGQYNPELHGRMTGYALALGLKGNHLSANIGWAHSLERPDVIARRETPIYVDVRLSL